MKIFLAILMLFGAMLMLAGCSSVESESDRVFVTSFPEPGAEIFAYQKGDWKFLGITPLFIHAEKKSANKGILLRVRYKGQVQEREVYQEGNIEFDFSH